MRAALLCLALLSVLAAPCIAQTENGQTVHRCIGEHGEIVFSGVACGGAEIGSATAAVHIDPRSSPAASDAASAAAMTCPRSPAELRDLFANALSRRDTNAITSLVRWNGVRGAEAHERLKEIAELGRRPLLGVELASDASLADDVPESSGTLTVRTGSTSYGGPSEREFRVGVGGGCYWLDW